jgi:hypothetical protein
MVRGQQNGHSNLGPASLHSGAKPDEQAQINLSPRTNQAFVPTCYLVHLLLVISQDVALSPSFCAAFGSISITPSSLPHLEEVYLTGKA